MSSSPTPGSDPELRALLEQIAATAGDPPEHGLDRVATLRRRRTRHRRRAVATTMALAVSGVATLTWLNTGPRDHDVSAASETDRGRWPNEPPSVLDVSCDATGIDVPVATIQPDDDGLHVHVLNEGNLNVEVDVVAEGTGWDSGPVEVEPGDEDFVQPVAPGVLTVGCQTVGGQVSDRRQVFLVDPDGLYSEPTLSCAVADQSPVDGELPTREPTRSQALVVEKALTDYWDEDTDEVVPLGAYPDQDFDYPTLFPRVQVLRDDEPVAFVDLEPLEDGLFDSVAEVTACDSFLVDPPSEERDENEDDVEAPDEVA